LNDSFFKLESILPYSISLRFHKSSPAEMALREPTVAAILAIAKEFKGCYNCSLPLLAYNLGITPF
jgi:hypothetical protein